MLTDDDFKALAKMIAEILEAYGLKKPPSSGALRMQRYRERHAASQNVTPRPEKRNGHVTKRHIAVTESDEPIVIEIPLNDGTGFGVTAAMVKEFEGLYPAVDVPQTLREIRGWNLTHPTRRKTRAGVMKHINYFLSGEQNKG